jgi:hypothetical protein
VVLFKVEDGNTINLIKKRKVHFALSKSGSLD